MTVPCGRPAVPIKDDQRRSKTTRAFLGVLAFVLEQFGGRVRGHDAGERVDKVSHGHAIDGFQSTISEGADGRLAADGLQLGARIAVHHRREAFQVDVIVEWHLSRVYLERLHAAIVVRRRDIDPTVKPAGAEEGRVDGQRPIGRAED